MTHGFAPKPQDDVARAQADQAARAPFPESAPPPSARRFAPAAILALQRTAGNAAVGRVLARQPADTDVKSSRRSVVIWEGRERGKKVKFKSKLSLRGLIPKGSSDTLDAIVGATEAENVRKKSSALETEFVALDGDIWKLTPQAFQDRMKQLGVKATIEFEPVDAAVKTAGAGEYALPSIDLMKFNAKLEWTVGKTVVELEISASLSPMALLGAADQKVLKKFESKVKELRKELLELDKHKAQLANATKEAEAASKALASARLRADARKDAVDTLKAATRDLDKAKLDRRAADAAAARAKSNPALQKKALEALARERDAEQVLKARTGDFDRIKAEVPKNEVKRASTRLASAKTAERGLKAKIERSTGTVTKLGRQAADIAKQGKSWVFKKVVGPRMIRVLGFLAKAIPILNVISLAFDLYEIGKLLWNWDKLKFGIGGGDGGPGGSGTGGKPDPSGKGSGTGGTGTSNAPSPGGGPGSDPWDPNAPTPPAPAPDPGKAPAGGATKPDPQGTSKTGTGTQGTGSGSGTAPPKQPAPPGSPPGQGTDPDGKADGPDGPTGTGKTGGTTGTGTTGTGTTGGGQATGGKDPAKQPRQDPAKQPADGKKKGDAKGKGTPGKSGGQGMPGQVDDPAAKKVKKPPPPAFKHVKAVAIKQAGPADVDVFAAGGTVQIAKFTGLNPWTAGRGKSPTRDVVHLTVKHDGQAFRVYGVPIVVVSRSEDLPPKTAGPDEYMIALVMEVSQTMKLAGTNLVINKGDTLHYTWEGSY
jgi:hypothetical protein